MNEEKDIKRFADIGDALKEMSAVYANPMYDSESQIAERSALYLEFLAGAFLQETGLKASETELQQFVGFDETGNTVIRWRFVKADPHD